MSHSPAENVLAVGLGLSYRALLDGLKLNLRKVTILERPCDAMQKDSKAPCAQVIAEPSRLPFKRHSFSTIISFGVFYSTRPSWTVLAEYHRVLIPDGKLMLSEPAANDWFAAMFDKLSGSLTMEKLKYRLARADFQIQSADVFPANGFRLNGIVAIKKENPAEPVPQFTTAKEMIARRKSKVPAGEQLP